MKVIQCTLLQKEMTDYGRWTGFFISKVVVEVDRKQVVAARVTSLEEFERVPVEFLTEQLYRYLTDSIMESIRGYLFKGNRP